LHRNEGGQILFIEFCDWAIRKQLGSQDDGGVAAPRAKGGEAGHVLPVAQEAITPRAAARSTRPRSAARDRPTRATPSAASKSQEYGGIIEKHSDYRCGRRILKCRGGLSEHLARCRELAAKLPTGKSESDKALRNKIFQQFDPNGNGFLSLAEVDKGVHDVLGLDVRAALRVVFALAHH
jgi:hypothetical protein